MLVLLAIILVLIASVVICFNAIVGKHNRVQRAWSDVLVYERQKTKILDALMEETSRFKRYEAELQTKVTALRSAIQALPTEPDGSALSQVQTQTKEVLNGVNLAFEAYPDLKTTEVVSGLMREIVDQQENVGAAVTIFNQGVEAFNNAIQMFPLSLVNQLLNKKQAITPFADTESSKAFEYTPHF